MFKSLGLILVQRLAGKHFNGGTTIAATMILAHLAGIKIFATGGLGGVHRGAESSMDISADLTELGRTPVAVISSGCKSFLDIPRTLEYLETEGASVATFADGRVGKVDFPAFWSRDSGVRSPLTIQDEKEAAAIICKYSMQFCSGASISFKCRRRTYQSATDIWVTLCEPNPRGIFNSQISNGHHNRRSSSSSQCREYYGQRQHTIHPLQDQGTK